MPDALSETAENVIQLWGLRPDEWLHLIAKAKELIREGRASDVGEVRNRIYICVYDRFGAPYTVGREQGLLHLLGPGGETIALGNTLDVIIHALDANLQRYD